MMRQAIRRMGKGESRAHHKFGITPDGHPLLCPSYRLWPRRAHHVHYRRSLMGTLRFAHRTG
jgi:hypothetical protein